MGRFKKSHVPATGWGKVLKDSDYTAAYVANHVGVDPSTVWNWVNGKYVPALPNIRKMCKLFNVPINVGKDMFADDHEFYLKSHASNSKRDVKDGKKNTAVTVDVPKSDDIVVDPTPAEIVSDEPTPDVHLHRIVCHTGTSRKVVVRHTNTLKQLFSALVDSAIDISSICQVLSAYDQHNGNIVEILNFIYLKVSAEDYRKICKAIEPMA